jgi:methylglutaconyl-CoA hydratase
MLAEFSAALESVRFDAGLRALIVRSDVPKVFCAGADLKERATMSPQQVAAFVHSIRASFTALANLPMPTIAAVEGAALGGGLEMALACDFRVAGEDALFGLTETSLAIIPGAGGTQRLSRAVGVHRAKELIFTARRLSASQANEYGLLTSLVAPGKAYDDAVRLAREIAANGPVAVRAAKTAIDRGSEVDINSGLAIESACYAHVIPTTDRLEGLAAFREKRRPLYKGQ